MTEPIDLGAARAGFIEVIGHWRLRRRTGELPAVARARIEAIDLPTLALDESRADLLCDVIEALAYSGLSTFSVSIGVAERDVTSAAPLQAIMSDRSATVEWPRLDRVMQRLGTTEALMLHTRRRMSDGIVQVLRCTFARPVGSR